MTVGSNFKSLFTDEIKNTLIPVGLKGVRVKSYDGSRVTNDHVANFNMATKMIPLDPKLWSLYFVGTLDGSSRYWQVSLLLKVLEALRTSTQNFAIAA